MRNVRFVTKKRLVVISNLHRWIIERDGSTDSGVLISKVRDTGNRGEGGGDYGLDVRDGTIGVYADDLFATNYVGTYNPYTADSDGNQINAYSCPANSTVGAFQENAFQANAVAKFDSNLNLYIAGQPDVTTDNSDGIWRLNPDGSIGPKFATSGKAVNNLDINDSDDLFVHYQVGGISGVGNLAKLNSSLVEQWSVSAAVNPRTLTVRNTSSTFFCTESGDVTQERQMSDGSIVSSYNGTYAGYFSRFRVDEKSGDFICGGNANQGVFRIIPDTDAIVWDGFTSSSINGMDIWYA